LAARVGGVPFSPGQAKDMTSYVSSPLWSVVDGPWKLSAFNADGHITYDRQNYLSAQVPFIWQPEPDYQLTEIADNLKGVTPQSTTLTITPENWYFVK
jgi:hypothetical protein